ncbi:MULTISPECIES: CDP-glycerol glycerophosphotransferase family protein [unclassified Sporosarcina]|uniref:CDP-glycerol glycerophosphotransferase family protein n=1 Tax=unclassified Sporosarcina TaxID=2647733 RepID=UPI00203C3661|nr:MULTISPECIES: CDP-glycerol glycerophosphotransferase family protein [unclassified Sporosarcina]GKV65012.1 glycerophosphotransferase [Sporosarcina sp. NCCP-2331]GLB56647.1 glycerophosphotransferase [Sporosarcina sp. NCCP-2378]
MRLKDHNSFVKLWYAMKIWMAYFLVKLFYRNDKDIIVLVGGNLGEKYEDNAAVFHQYLIDHYSSQMKIYWMFDPQFDYINQFPIPHAVPLGSFQNYVLFFRARYTVHGHSIIYDLAPYMDRFIFLNKKTVMLHISHGIECFKKILIQKEDVPLLKRCNLFNCASAYEHKIKSTEWKIAEDKLIITGMARFDRLPPDQPPVQLKRLLLMFTWREWLFDMTEQEFLESKYYRSTVGLLQSAKMQSLIAEQQLTVRVLLHPFMKKYETYFRKDLHVNDHVSFFSFDDVLIMDELHAADMLITDYSSISWDFLYMNKPIIFYTFDQKEFLANRGSYLDLDADLFGYKGNTEEEVLMHLSRALGGNHYANPYFSKASDYIDFFDQQNCERLARTLFRDEIAHETKEYTEKSAEMNEFPLVSAQAVQYNCNK